MPTWEGTAPSLDAKLYGRTPGTDHLSNLSSRSMKFIYGYVKAKPGAVRYGWMALDGLKMSGSCPNR